MCGIAGMIGRRGETIAPAQVRDMTDTIVHRGPDDEGIHVRGNVGLGMRRLSIIDLSGGRQPIYNEDRTVAIVFNGEIYNFQELRRGLESRGHEFRTHSDTEVIVHLYEEMGADCVTKLRGMFAIALYDEKRDTLLLARDRLGKKPLFYAQRAGRLFFGSEIKALLAAAPELAEVDPEGVLQFFYYGYIPDPQSAFRDIRKLPPGSVAEYRDGEIQVRQYWDVPAYGENDPGSDEACLEEMERRLADAVRVRLISDVPLGALLSGGVDSSIVVALMARESSGPVKTFSIGFQKADFNEAEYARLVAQRFGTDHHELVVDPDITETLNYLTGMMEEPFGDSSMIPTYCVSQLARQYVTVALSGDGGDELFAGYDRYMVNLKRRRFEVIPNWVGDLFRNHLYPHLPSDVIGRKLAWNITLPSRDRYLDDVSFLPVLHRERGLFSEEFVDHARKCADPLGQFQRYYDDAPANDQLSRLMYLDTKTYLAGDILTKVDRMSMATSLEMRCPILDHVFVEWVAGLPAKYKVRDGTRKFLFKKLAERLGVPAEILNRRKQGFALPLVHWMRHELKDGMLQMLQEPRTMQRGYFRADSVRVVLDEHFRGRRDHSGVLWMMLVFELWHRNFLEKGKGIGGFLSMSARNYLWQERRAGWLGGQSAVTVSLSSAQNESGAAAAEISRPGVFLMTNTLETGGSERQFVTMAKALDRDKFSVDLGCLKPFGPFLSEVEGIMRFAAGGSLFGWQSLQSRLALSKFLRGQRTAVAQSFDFYSNLMLIPAARLAGVPVVLGSHRQLGDLLTPMQFRAQNAVFRVCDRVVCNSRAAAERLQEAGVRSGKLIVIPNGLPDELFAPVAPSLSYEANIVRIGMISRMNHPVKQHDFFLRVAAQLVPRCPQARFVLVGDGPLRSGLEVLVEQLGLRDRVVFLGDRRDIPAVLASLDITVLPSSSESLSNVVMESMAAGVAVVASNVGGNPELVENGVTGFLFAPGDEEQFAAALETLITQPELRKRFGSSARKRALAEYTIPRVRDRYQDLYRSLLAEKGWAAPLATERLQAAGTGQQGRSH